MIYYHFYDEYQYEANPDGFRMPYKFYGKLDRQIKEAKYFQMRPTSTLLKKRLIGSTYGGLSFK